MKKQYRYEVRYIDSEGDEVVERACDDLNTAREACEWITFATRFDARVVDTWTKENVEV